MMEQPDFFKKYPIIDVPMRLPTGEIISFGVLQEESRKKNILSIMGALKYARLLEPKSATFDAKTNRDIYRLISKTGNIDAFRQYHQAHQAFQAHMTHSIRMAEYERIFLVLLGIGYVPLMVNLLDKLDASCVSSLAAACIGEKIIPLCLGAIFYYESIYIIDALSEHVTFYKEQRSNSENAILPLTPHHRERSMQNILPVRFKQLLDQGLRTRDNEPPLSMHHTRNSA